MPKVKLLEDRMPVLLPMQGRSKDKVHVSEVIHDLCIRLGHYKELREEERNPAYLELGNSFEQIQILRLQQDSPDRYILLGELDLDDIPGTPDLFDIICNQLVEIKFTFMSSRHGPGSKKFWKYEVQIMSYCYMIGINVAVLRVCHVMGDYKGSGPAYRPYEYTFTQQELEDNWRMIKDHAHKVKRKIL